MLRVPRSRDASPILSDDDGAAAAKGVGVGVGGLFAPAGATTATGSSPCSNRKKITFARLATCILNVGRARKKTSRAREEELLQAAESGDVARLRTLVLGRDLNFESTDQLGRTPLHLAVVNDHKEAVKFLLDYVDRRRVYQALLAAINLGNEEIAELIIEHPKYEEISEDLSRHGKSFFYQNKFNDDNQFSEEITPLILAAQQNRFEVVMALLLKQETIEKPHKCHCPCKDCLDAARLDELKFARSRLNAYRALSSEAYISLSSDDPILTSFRLRRELQQVADEEKYYTAEYSALASKLSEYVVRLLDKVHGNDELNAILNACSDDECDTYRASAELARLQLAIEYREKKFVAHPSCQKKLTTLWYGDFYKLLKRRSTLVQTGVVILISLLYPILAVTYMLAPDTTVGKLLTTPCVKFVAQAASYLFFLGLILIHGHVEQGKLCTTRVVDLGLPLHHLNSSTSSASRADNLSAGDDDTLKDIGRMCIRNHKPAIMEVCIVLWISGLMWAACKQVYRVGCRAHFIDIYNAMDFFMLKFYTASLILKRLTDVMVQSSVEYFKKESSWRNLSAKKQEAVYRMYWLNADRFYWDAWDPVHVCEALFAVGNILNFARLFHLLAINEHLGPMLISLERMIKDVMKFMVTFVPIFLAFMVGMYNLYWYYDPSVRSHVELVDHKITTRAEEGFGNLEYTFRTIFWALFGLKDAKTVELGQGFQSRFTESVGYIVFGVYNWGAVIVLLNMLIAMMTRSFDKIATDQDIEWKFVRSKLYMEYIREGSALPVPFNIVPTPRSIAGLVIDCLNILRRRRASVSIWRRHRRHRDTVAGETGPGVGLGGDALDADESLPIYNGICQSPNVLPMSHVYRESNDDLSRSNSHRSPRPTPATAATPAAAVSTATTTLGGSFPKPIQHTSSFRQATHIGGDRTTTDKVTVSSASRLAFHSPASTQPTAGATGDVIRGRWSGAARVAVSAVRPPLSSAASVVSMPSPCVSASARKVWRAAHQRRTDTDLPVGVGSVGSTVRPSRDVSMETTAGGDLEESRPIIKTVVRRYIFERLLTSVVPNEGSNELESIQQTTAAISDGLNTVLPTMTDQFATTQRQLADLQRSINELQRQIAPLLLAVNTPTEAAHLRTTTITTTTTNGYSNSHDVADSGSTVTKSKTAAAAADTRANESGCRLRSSASTNTDVSRPLLPTSVAMASQPLVDVAVTSGATSDVDVCGRCVDANVTCPATTYRRVKKAASATVGSHESSWRVSSLLHRQNATTSDEYNSPDGTAATDHVIWRQQSEYPSATAMPQVRQQQQQQLPSSPSLSHTVRLPMTVEEQANADGRFSSETVFTFTL